LLAVLAANESARSTPSLHHSITPSLHHSITPRAGFEDEDDDENEAPYAGFIATATNRFAFTS
jgi:hypothetical protein